MSVAAKNLAGISKSNRATRLAGLALADHLVGAIRLDDTVHDGVTYVYAWRGELRQSMSVADSPFGANSRASLCMNVFS